MNNGWNTTDNQKPAEAIKPKELDVEKGQPQATNIDPYLKQQMKENKQQMKMQCLSLAQNCGAIYNEHGKVSCDYAKVIEAAKAYYDFVRK